MKNAQALKSKERLERGYIVDDLKKYNDPKYGVTQPEAI
jgi:hypothetical protein